MYLTYAEFTEFGGSLDESTFNILEYEARTYIDWVTFNRLANEVVIPSKVKECMFYLINVLYKKQIAFDTFDYNEGSTSTSNAIVKSRSNDGVSASYNSLDAKDIIKELNDDSVNRIIKRSLQGVTNSLGRKLLYRGLYSGE